LRSVVQPWAHSSDTVAPLLHLTLREAGAALGLRTRDLGRLQVPERFANDADGAAIAFLISQQNALVKTVKNGDWLTLLWKLSHEPFRSSFTLPPPSGRMHLFGGVTSQSVGLVFDRRALDMSQSVCWPPGYFAKSEFHLHVEPDGNVRLTGGRAAHRITLERLLAINLEENLREERGAEPGEEPPLYNEINLRVHGTSGLCAVFVRSTAEESTRFAMGVRDLLQHVFPCLPPLPLLRLTPTAGVSVVSRLDQLAVLRVAPEAVPRPSLDAQPRLPVDALAFPELALEECLQLHCSHGITHRSLHAALEALGGTKRLAHHVARSLCAAALVDNVASAREVVRTAAPLLLRPLLATDQTGVSLAAKAAKAAVAAASLPPKLSHAWGGLSHASTSARGEDCLGIDLDMAEDQSEDQSDAEASETTKAEEERRVTRCVDSVLGSVGTLKRACSAERSEGMLVALGAQITLSEFVAGRTAQRLSAACRWLQDWCERAAQGPCSPPCLVFLTTSWLEAREVDGNSDWLSFFTGKAVSNRLVFHDLLTKLLQAQQRGDGLEYVSQLYQLSARLRKPCLRLRILQQVLGLDTRFSRDIVHGVICLAFDVLEDMGKGGGVAARSSGSGAGAGGTGGTGGTGDTDGSAGARDNFIGGSSSSWTSSPPCATASALPREASMGSCLHKYDEATKLDAEALFGAQHGAHTESSYTAAYTSPTHLATLGPPALVKRPSDPVGESSRRNRVAYYYR